MGLQLVNKEEITALWTKIKKNFAMVGQNAVTSGSLMYFDSAKEDSDSKTVSTLGLPASNVRDNSVLGITSGLPAWKTISSSLAFSTNTSSALKLRVTVLGTQSAELTMQEADASHLGVVNTGPQTFAGAKTFNGDTYHKNHIILDNNKQIQIYDNPATGTATAMSIMYVSSTTNELVIGNGLADKSYGTVISGNRVRLRYGNRIEGLTLDSNGDVTVVHNIQSTQGGVAAMGLADLSTSGSGGGSGTVKEIYIGSTLYPTDVDGKVTLPDYPVFSSLSTNIANSYAVSATIGGVTKNITVSDMRTVLGLGGTPDTEGGVAILGTGGKIKLSQIPDAILGQVVYAGQVTSYTSSSIVGVTMSTSAKRMMETKKGYAANTLDGKTIRITTSASSSVSGSTYTFSYSDCEGMYFLWGSGAIASGSDYREWASERFEVGDWCISNGDKWGKVDNTDAVTSVNGHTGPVTLTKSDVGLSNVDNVSIYSWDGRNASTGHTSNITHVGTIAYGTWQGTAIANSYVKSTANGQLLIGNGTTMDLLAKGTNGQYLKSGSSTLEWATFPAPTATWNESISSNPTLTITDVGGSVTSAAIPAARAVTENNTTTYYSGVVTTGQQAFTGNKIFNSKTTFNSSLELWTNEFQYSPDQSTEPTTRKQDLIIGYNSNNNFYNGTPFWRIYSYEESPSGIGYMPIEIGMAASGGNSTYNGALFFSGNLTDNPLCWGVGTPTPQYKFHVNGTFGVESTSTFKDNVNVANGKYINFYDNPSDQQTNPSLVNVLNLNSSNNLHLGYGMNTKGYNTYINGNRIVFRYGSSATIGMALTADGNLGIGTINPLDKLYVSGGFTATSNIQSTGGGVAAMGIADLALSGGGGGSGTVQSLQVNTALPIIPNTDGKLSLDAALTSGTDNAVSLTIGGSTLNITQSALRTALGLGAAAYHGTTTSVTSGSGSLITSGGVYSNTVSALGTSGNNLTWTKGGTTNSITVPYATNADKIDDVHLWEFYKQGRVYRNDTASNYYYLVGEASETGWSKSLTISFYVCSSYTSAEYGILNVTYRTPSNATSTNGIFQIFWTVAIGIDPSKFIFTYKNTDNAFTFRIYVQTSANWRSYSFRKLDEVSWGSPVNGWTMNPATTGSAYNVASIPADETQVVSTISNINNKAADSAMLNGQSASYYATVASLGNYLPLTGGTMTLTDENSLVLNTGHIGAIRVKRTNSSYSVIQFNGLVSSADTHLGSLGFSGVNTPVFREAGGNYKTLWHAGNANLEVTRDSQQEPTGFEFAMGAESIGVSTVGVDYINNLS